MDNQFCQVRRAQKDGDSKPGSTTNKKKVKATKKSCDPLKSPHTINIFVSTTFTSMLNISVSPNSDVLELKENIADRLGIASEKQELYIGSLKMSNLLTLADHGVKDQSNIQVKVGAGLLGGADSPPDSTAINMGSANLDVSTGDQAANIPPQQEAAGAGAAAPIIQHVDAPRDVHGNFTQNITNNVTVNNTRNIDDAELDVIIERAISEKPFSILARAAFQLLKNLFEKLCIGSLTKWIPGSVILVVRFSSRQELKNLWEMYNNGELKAEITKILNSDTSNETCGSLQLEITIDKEEYIRVWDTFKVQDSDLKKEVGSTSRQLGYTTSISPKDSALKKEVGSTPAQLGSPKELETGQQSTRGGIPYEDLCKGTERNYSFHLVDLVDKSTNRCPLPPAATKVLVDHVEEIFENIKKFQSQKEVSDFQFGKTSVKSKAASFDRKKPETWALVNISGRWNYYMNKNKGYDGLIILTAITNDIISDKQAQSGDQSQKYANDLVRALEQEYKLCESDSPSKAPSKRRSQGGTATDLCASVVFLAYQLREAGKQSVSAAKTDDVFKDVSEQSVSAAKTADVSKDVSEQSASAAKTDDVCKDVSEQSASATESVAKSLSELNLN